jgi:hypothetical protein
MRTFLLCGVIVLVCLWLRDTYYKGQPEAQAAGDPDQNYMATLELTMRYPAFIDFDWQYQRLPLGTQYHDNRWLDNLGRPMYTRAGRLKKTEIEDNDPDIILDLEYKEEDYPWFTSITKALLGIDEPSAEGRLGKQCRGRVGKTIAP